MASPSPFDPRITRRQAVGRSMGSLALVCALPGASSLTRTSAGSRRRGRRGRAVPDGPADPAGARPGAQHRDRGPLRRHDPGGPRGDHPRHAHAGLRLRRDLPRADDPRPQGPHRRGAADERAGVPAERAPARRDHAGRVRRPPDGPDPAGHVVRLHVHQHPGRGDALVPRPRARPLGADDVLRPRRLLHRRGRPGGRSWGCRPATSTCRWRSRTARSTRTARSGTRRTSTRASWATRSSSTAPCHRGSP